MRTKGWVMPDGAVYVGRPTIFGNPHHVVDYGLELSLKLFTNTAQGIWSPMLHLIDDERLRKKAYQEYLAWTKRIYRHPVEVIRSTLRGKDLACWCPLADDKGNPRPCHADVLLAIANND